MIGIVIVSHSAKLAAGVLELAQQMTQVEVPIAIAAGIDDPKNPLGTDVMQVKAAIESVYNDSGVLVLMDLGSAILSAEMALEFLPEEHQSKVRLCAAPLVEGVIAAAVQAATGADIEQVMAEAKSALIAKASQLSVTIEKQDNSWAGEFLGRGTKEICLSVENMLGIHARPAAKLVATANQFQSQITLQNLTKNSNIINAKSINQVVTLGVLQRHKIAITATGSDAEEALAALQQLVVSQFGETDTQRNERASEHKSPLPPCTIAPVPPQEEGTKLQGLPAAAGIAIGSIVLYQAVLPDVVDQQADNPQAEWQQLQLALETAKEQIQALVSNIPAGSNDEASIFQAHLLYLQDPALLTKAYQRIFEQHQCAAAAWKSVIEEMVAVYQNLEDSYLQTRAADITEVGQRVLQLLIGASTISLDLPQSGILVAPDLTAAEVAQLQPEHVLGICTAAGSATAHSTIIAKMLGIPMVVGVGEQLLSLPTGTQLGLDGNTGQVWVQPNATDTQHLTALQAGDSEGKDELPLEAITQDGHKITVLANIMGVSSAQLALKYGAEGVGLLRTEFLYLDRLTPPTPEEQLKIYQAIAEIFGLRPLTIRTLDIGGDKSIPYMNLAAEANPCLGWRGIRQSLDCPEIFKTQLRAIVKASYGHNLKLMFPLVSSVQEVRAAKQLVAEVQMELQQTGIPFNRNMKVGIMVEVPAAVIIAEQLAAEVDFFSIGTNDLSQYTMAADRTNPKVASLADALEPALLRMIEQTVTAAKQAGITVSVCGELASQPEAIPILLGLGVDELSMNPAAIPTALTTISQLRITEAKVLANKVLKLDSAESVRNCS
ncbi:MAG: phosphoenolpyruvate--protein phosphotransferase [Symploca sp. SIO3C6]|nr:phosphoenolpyruvate--protein phosphotransferase [Symploca sp. SIO3C6]